MDRRVMVVSAVVLLGTVVALGGCGDSHPIPSNTKSSSQPRVDKDQSVLVPVHAPEGAFVEDPARSSSGDGAAATQQCNLDATNGAPAGTVPLVIAARVVLAGWAASGGDAAVPGEVAVVLRGARDYSVRAPTGVPRPDVAAATHKPTLANSGYAVDASMAAVPPGQYKVELRYTIGSQLWRCETRRVLTIR